MPLGNLKKYLNEVQLFFVMAVSRYKNASLAFKSFELSDSNTCRSNKHLYIF